MVSTIESSYSWDDKDLFSLKSHHKIHTQQTNIKIIQELPHKTKLCIIPLYNTLHQFILTENVKVKPHRLLTEYKSSVGGQSTVN